jgi:hypothetical protein
MPPENARVFTTFERWFSTRPPQQRPTCAKPEVACFARQHRTEIARVSGGARRGKGYLERGGINGFHAALLGKREISSPQKESLRYRPCKSDRGAHVIVTQSNASAGRLNKPADSGVSSSAKWGSGITRSDAPWLARDRGQQRKHQPAGAEERPRHNGAAD